MQARRRPAPMPPPRCRAAGLDLCRLPQYVDLRTRYSELTTLTSQYIKFITETLRRLEEEEVGQRRAGARGARHDSGCILSPA